tara:strand:- start:274 stop:540 length:267 start_codon:yes stop_codon:yes gene_type:complete
MAIKKSLVLKSNLGDEVNVLCYIRVQFANTTKQAVICQYDLMRDGQDHVIESKQNCFAADMSTGAPNIWTQCYSALKALPEFAGAVDC